MNNTLLFDQTIDTNSISRALFHEPFDLKRNFAINDPLLLSKDKNVIQEGITFTKKFGSGSITNSNLPAYFKEKSALEKHFNDQIGLESSLLINEIKDPFSFFTKQFCSSHQVIIPKGKNLSVKQTSPKYYETRFFVDSLKEILEKCSNHSLPIVYLDKSDIFLHHIDIDGIKQLKDNYSFFLFVENKDRFSLEGFNGYGSLKESSLCDILITHIPKTFGTLAMILSGEKHLIEAFGKNLTVEIFLITPTFLGMIKSIFTQMQVFSFRREKLNLLRESLSKIFPTKHIGLSSFTLELENKLRSDFTHKALIEKGFLLKTNSKKGSNYSLDLYLHYHQDTSNFLQIKYIIEESNHQHISDSI